MSVNELLPSNVVITEFINNMFDIQRNTTATDTDFGKLLSQLTKSVVRFDTKVVLLTNIVTNTSTSTLMIHSMKLNHGFDKMNLYFYRWLICYEFLLDHPEVEKAALVDATDVEMLNYPFDDIQSNKLYIGDELYTLRSYIIRDDSAPTFVKEFINQNLNLQLLNAGVLVGTRAILMEFLSIVIKVVMDDQVLRVTQPDVPHFGEYEMTVMNYVAYRYFGSRLYHGRTVSTLFTAQTKQSHSWFRHK